MKIFCAVVQMSRPLKKRNLPNHLNKVAPYLQFCSLGAWVPQSLAKVKLIYISCSAQQLYWYPKRNLDISCFHKYVTILFHKYVQLIQWCSCGSPSLGFPRVCHCFIGSHFCPDRLCETEAYDYIYTCARDPLARKTQFDIHQK